MNAHEYKKYVKEHTQKSNEIKTLSLSFIVGGIICTIGQAFGDLYKVTFPYLSENQNGSLISVTMIFLGALLTGLGIYDKIGYHAGGGSIVPITGFANSIVAPAMEFNKEGIVLGVMAKMFVIAGPIIVTGIFASVVSGIVFFIIGVV